MIGFAYALQKIRVRWMIGDFAVLEAVIHSTLLGLLRAERGLDATILPPERRQGVGASLILAIT